MLLIHLHFFLCGHKISLISKKSFAEISALVDSSFHANDVNNEDIFLEYCHLRY